MNDTMTYSDLVRFAEHQEQLREYTDTIIRASANMRAWEKHKAENEQRCRDFDEVFP